MYRTLKISGCFLPKNRTLNSSKFYPIFLNYHATLNFYPYVFLRKRVMQGDFVHLSVKLENPLSFICLSGILFLDYCRKFSNASGTLQDFFIVLHDCGNHFTIGVLSELEICVSYSFILR